MLLLDRNPDDVLIVPHLPGSECEAVIMLLDRSHDTFSLCFISSEASMKLSKCCQTAAKKTFSLFLISSDSHVKLLPCR